MAKKYVDVRTSQVASRVLFSIVQGFDYPQAIAKQVNFHHSGTVIPYLSKLQEEHLITKHKKARPQIYEVNWPGIARLWKKEWHSFFAAACSDSKPKELKEIMDSVDFTLSSIEKNRLFFLFLIELFHCYRPQTVITLRQVLTSDFKQTVDKFLKDAINEKKLFSEVERQGVIFIEATGIDEPELQKLITALASFQGHYGQGLPADVRINNVAFAWQELIRKLDKKK